MDTNDTYHNFPNRNGSFHGRNQLLNHINNKLLEYNEETNDKDIRKNNNVTILSGMGGVGKSSIALAYGYSHYYKTNNDNTNTNTTIITNNNYSFLKWFHAENSEELLMEWVAFADLLGIATNVNKEDDTYESSTINEEEMKENTSMPPLRRQNSSSSRLITTSSIDANIGANKNINELRKRIYEKLYTMGNWLIVFDNVPNYYDIISYLPENKAKNEFNQHILITTRSSKMLWNELELSVIDVSTFTDDEAVEFWQNQLPEASVIGMEACLTSSQALGNLPLAMSQAVAYIQNVESATMSSYVTQINNISNETDNLRSAYAVPISSNQNNRRRIMDETVALNITNAQIKDNNRNNNNININSSSSSSSSSSSNTEETEEERRAALAVERSGRMNIDRVLNESFLAFDILFASAYLNPDGIPISLMVSLFNEKLESEVFDAIVILQRYSLIETVDGGKYKMHRLLQKMLRNIDSLEAFGSKEDEDALKNIKNNNSNLYKKKKEKKGFFSGLLGFIGKKKQTIQSDDNEENKYNEFIKKKQEEYPDKSTLDPIELTRRIMHERLWPIKDAIIEIHPWDPNGREELSLLRSLLPNIISIVTHFDSLSPGYIPEEDGPYRDGARATAELLSYIGSALWNLRDSVGQKQIFERLLTLTEELYGPDSTDVAAALNGLSNAVGDLGDMVTQKDLLERALRINEAHYGVDSKEVSVTLVNLSSALGSLGLIKRKRELLERAIKIDISEYGEDHINVGTTKVNLGTALQEIGKIFEAKEMMEDALRIFENHYGSDNPQIATVLCNLAIIYGEIGKPEEEKNILLRALHMEEELSGPDSHRLSPILGNLAVAYGSLGLIEEKKRLLERSWELYARHYGEEHVFTMAVYSNLAMCYSELGNPAKGKEMQEKALAAYEAHYGPNHYGTVGILTNLASDIGLLGDPIEKKTILERCLTLSENHYGKDHLQVSIVLNDLGNSYGELGDARKRIELLERSIEIVKTFYEDPDHILIILRKINLACGYGEIDDQDKKFELINYALPHVEKFYGSEHHLVGTTKAIFGDVYERNGDYTNAILYYEQALPIYKRFYGIDHFQTAQVYTSYGSALRGLKNYEEAKNNLEHALEIFDNFYGEDNIISQTGRTLIELSKLLYLQYKKQLDDENNLNNLNPDETKIISMTENEQLLIDSNNYLDRAILIFERLPYFTSEHILMKKIEEVQQLKST